MRTPPPPPLQFKNTTHLSKNLVHNNIKFPDTVTKTTTGITILKKKMASKKEK
jgi:hypothetical protein